MFIWLSFLFHYGLIDLLFITLIFFLFVSGQVLLRPASVNCLVMIPFNLRGILFIFVCIIYWCYLLFMIYACFFYSISAIFI
jgi:hypothetical protein